MTSLDDFTNSAKSQRPDGAGQSSPHATLDTTMAQAQEAASQQHLGTIAPVDPRGQHELLRLAAGLAPFLHGVTGDAIVEATTAMGVEPARIERVVSSLKEHGVIALVDGVLYALGTRSFLEDIGVRPRGAEVRVAERIERAGDVPYFIGAVARAHCLGVFGAPNMPEQPDGLSAQ